MTSFHFLVSLTLILCTITVQMSIAGTMAPSASASRYLFATDIFKAIGLENTDKNVILSPTSIQSCLTMAFFGAGGATAKELRAGLRLGDAESTQIAQNYGDFLKDVFQRSADGPQLRMASRIYVNENLRLVPEFNAIASKYFQSQAESVRFADGAQVAAKINKWVEQQTDNKIKNLLPPDAVTADTSTVLVNAIYFKAKWKHPFSESSTHKADFIVNAKKVSVDMMFLNERFRCADLPELDATALEMPYENSDLSMLLLLPNKVDGLLDLERKLATVDLNELTSKLQTTEVDVFLPKFKIEYDVDLKKPLIELGMSKMFSDEADFSALLTSDARQQKVSEVRHKAFLDVNEAGSEAAAATFIKIVPMSLNLNLKTFRANHPFVFAIRNSKAVYFSGHVAKF